MGCAALILIRVGRHRATGRTTLSSIYPSTLDWLSTLQHIASSRDELIPGFQSGNPYAIAPWVNPAFGDKYHVVSLAYRYIPQCSLMESVQDCIDGFTWLRSNLPSVVPGVDVDKYIVAGDSAGGTLACLMGHHLSPPPKAVVNVYGVVDLLEPHFYKAVPAALDLTGKDDLKKRLDIAIADRDKANAAYARPARFHLDLPIETLRSFWGVEDLKIDKDEALFECDIYDYVTALGQRMRLMLREEECKGQEEFDQRAKDHSATYLLDTKKEKGNKAYPPTYVLHGTGDTLVPVQQGRDFENKLKELGVEVQSQYPEGEPHGFDQRINVSDVTRNDGDEADSQGPDSSDWETVVKPIIAFVEKHTAK